MKKIPVESLKTHGYSGRARVAGSTYSIEEKDLQLLLKLGRVKVLTTEKKSGYQRKDMRAGE